MRGAAEDSDQIGGPFLFTLNILFDHSQFEIHKRAQILSAQRELAARDGVFVEPASAAGVAGLLAELARGPEHADYSGATVAVTVTGHGLKDTATALEGLDSVVDTVVDADVEQAARAAGLTS